MRELIVMALFYIAMVIVNALSNTLPINGQTASEISNKIDVLFTPAGYVFSIWSFIYFLLAGWLLILFLHHKKTPFTNKRLATLFCISCALNISWLFAFHYEFFILSVFIMIGLLLTIILIYLSYPIGDKRIGGRLPFSIYLGWISVATIANISYTLKYYDVSLGINEVSGTIILLVIAACIAITGRYISDDPFFATVFVWAIIGIAVKNTEPNLVAAAYIIAVFIFILILVLTLASNNRAQQK